MVVLYINNKPFFVFFFLEIDIVINTEDFLINPRGFAECISFGATLLISIE